MNAGTNTGEMSDVVESVSAVTRGGELKAVGVAEGGLLQPVRRTLFAKCLPREIPENIVIDVTALGIGDAIHLSDLDIEGVEFDTSVDFTIVTVQTVAQEEEVVVDDDEISDDETETEAEAEDAGAAPAE